MLSVSRGTSILCNKCDLESRKDILYLKIISICETYKLKSTYNNDQEYKREIGKIKKAINGINHDIHNLATIIDMMENIYKNKEGNNIYNKGYLYLGILLESYYTNLRSIFDFIPEIIKIGLDKNQIKSLPNTDSYNKLLKYTNNANNNGKLPEILIQNIRQGEHIFNIIKTTRDAIIHKGDEAILFIENEEVYFAILKLTDKGQVNLVENILGMEKLIYPLFEYIGKLTNMVFEYLELLADTVHYIWSENEGKEIPVALSVLNGSCIPNFIEFLSITSKEK